MNTLTESASLIQGGFVESPEQPPITTAALVVNDEWIAVASCIECGPRQSEYHLFGVAQWVSTLRSLLGTNVQHQQISTRRKWGVGGQCDLNIILIGARVDCRYNVT